VGLNLFCITVAYDGTAYAGWQVQPNAATIQGVLERAAEELNGEPTSVLGAGRTDAGVHARGQAARFSTGRGLSAAKVPAALNAHLPEDVVVTAARAVEPGFHPIRDAVAKHYRYTFRQSPVSSPFDRRFVLRVDDDLDLDAMRRSAGFLRGKHDFAGFEKSGSPRDSTVRTLLQLDVTASEDYIYADFVGTGFLYGMARNLAGTLLRAGRGKLDPEAIPAGLAERSRAIAGPCLAAHGLCLMKVDYGG
jgi:tRNA pseudouridine38-40 synthase